MPDTPTPFTPLRSGLNLGPNRILRWLGTSDVGADYEVTFGTTTHVYRLVVVSSDLGVDLETLDAVLKPLSSVSHPCLAKPFAWGCDEGLLWIRSELSVGVPLGSFALPPDDKANPWRRGEMVTDAGKLRDLCRGAVPQALLWPIVGDLLEGLASLHRAGLAVGPFKVGSVVFQMGRHGHGVVAKWAGYGLRPLHDAAAAVGATVQGDVRSAGVLVGALLCGDGGRLPATAWPEWAEFLSRCAGTTAGFADGVEMYHAFLGMLDARGLKRDPRHAEPDASTRSEAETVEPAGAEAKPREHERRKRVGARRRHHDSASEGSAAAAQMSPALRVFIILIVLCLIGYGAYWLISRGDRLRKEGFVGASARKAAVEKTGPAAAEAIDYWQLDRAGLEDRVKTGDASATLRFSFMVAMGDDAQPADEKRGAELARPAVALLQKRVENEQSDGDTLYWLGYAQLTGFGIARDEARGRAALEQAMSLHNHPRAVALLADYLAFGHGESTPESDLAALQLWQKAVDVQQTLTPFTSECVDKVVAFVLAGRGLPRGDAPAVVKWLESVTNVTRLRHAGAMVGMGMLALEGRLVPLNEPQAMDWFRSAARTGSAEGMRRMAWMYERGVGTPQSDKSAAIWYRRAALGGDAEAMEQLAALMAAGRGDEVPDATAEAELRRKAVAAKAAALARTARLMTWWQPGVASASPAAASAPADPAASLSSKTEPPSSTDKPVPPVAPGLMHPGEGTLVPME